MKRIAAIFRQILRAQYGRPLASALLVGLIVLAQFPEHNPFNVAKLHLFDQYQRVFPRERVSAPVVIVEIDEDSINELGQWPWPRDRTAQLLQRIGRMNPAAIGVGIFMPERDQTSPSALAARLPANQQALRKALLALPDNDQVLAEAIRATPTVLGVAGVTTETKTSSRMLDARPMRESGGSSLGFLRHYPFVLASLPEMQAAAAGQGVMSVDQEGGVARQVPLVMAIGGTPTASLAVEMLRVAAGAPNAEIVIDDKGITAIQVAGLNAITQDNGSVWVHFGKVDEKRYFSALDVLENRIPEETFRDRLVLVGLSAYGLVDNRVTPLGQNVPGLEIQAQLIETLFDGHGLLRPRWMPWAETALLAIGGALLIWLVPVLKARVVTMLAGTLYVVLFGLGFALFKYGNLLLDAASAFASLNIVLGSLLGSAYVYADRERRMIESALQRTKSDANAGSSG